MINSCYKPHSLRASNHWENQILFLQSFLVGHSKTAFNPDLKDFNSEKCGTSTSSRRSLKVTEPHHEDVQTVLSRALGWSLGALARHLQGIKSKKVAGTSNMSHLFVWKQLQPFFWMSPTNEFFPYLSHVGWSPHRYRKNGPRRRRKPPSWRWSRPSTRCFANLGAVIFWLVSVNMWLWFSNLLGWLPIWLICFNWEKARREAWFVHVSGDAHHWDVHRARRIHERWRVLRDHGATRRSRQHGSLRRCEHQHRCDTSLDSSFSYLFWLEDTRSPLVIAPSCVLRQTWKIWLIFFNWCKNTNQFFMMMRWFICRSVMSTSFDTQRCL